MNISGGLLCLQLLWTVLGSEAQSSYYKRSYYNPVSSQSSSRFFHHNDGFVPMTYTSDLLTEESKRKDSAKKYSKLIPFRPQSSEEDDHFSTEHFSSAEYSNEALGFNSKENDSREYSIGTQIRVQHPITVPKKTTSSHPKHHRYGSQYKGSSYSDVNLSSEVVRGSSHSPDLPPPTRKHPQKYAEQFERDSFHIIPPPKSTAASTHSSYHVYEPDQEEYEAPRPSSTRIKSSSRDRFKSVASNKQIEAYLKDQKKLIDEALKVQLLTNSDYQQFLKSKGKHILDDDEFEISNSPPSPIFRPNFDENLTFKPNRPRRRPPPADLKRSPKGNLQIKPRRRFRSPLVISV